jgi:AcrR family transcriptional regulator
MQKRQKRSAAKSDPRRIPLSRDHVLREAIMLADERGLESLTMRELGKRLGVEAMSLYNHVTGKDEVLDGMLDMVVVEIEAPARDEDDWRSAMRARAVSAREVFSRHPWAAALIDSRIRSGPERLRYLDSIIGTLRRAGFSIELAARAFSLLDCYVYGFARQRGSIASADAGGRAAAEEFLDALPAGDYPYLAQMAARQAESPGYDEAGDFEFGLELILEGLGRILLSDREAPA